MKMPFINADECSHDEWELKPNSEQGNYTAQWHGEHVNLTRIRTYNEHCADCGKQLSTMGHDAEGNVGWETLESFTIPAEVVEQYRDGAKSHETS